MKSNSVFLESASIKNKLILIILSVTTFILSLAFIFIISQNILSKKNDLESNVTVTARLMGDYSVVPITFNDNREASKILAKIESIPALYAAALYTNEGALFAEYQKPGTDFFKPTYSSQPFTKTTFKKIKVSHKINYKNQEFGTIYLEGTTQFMLDDIYENIVILIILFIILLFLSYFIALKIQNLISKPILELARVTENIRDNPDFNLRVTPKGKDEIALLFTGFNNMLEQLQFREKETQNASLALRESEEKLRAIMDNTSAMIYVKDLDGKFILVNSQLEKTLNMPIDKIRGRTDKDFFDADEAEIIMKNDKQVFKENKPLEFEESVTENNICTTFLSIKFPMYDASHNVIAIGGISTNITERKLIETELRTYRENLELLVEEKTEELKKAQEDLIEKEKLATLGNLIATVSHELRNPLGTIRSSVFNINDAIDLNRLDQAKRAIDLAERNVERCDSIITEMLNYIRKKDLFLKPVQFDSWLQDFFREYKVPAEINFELNTGFNTKINLDIEHIRRALINVLDNAIDALQESNKDSKLLNVKTREDAGSLVLEITDNGLGIPTENEEKIFEPLFSTKGFGVGLGIPIVKNIISEHNGKMAYVNNEIGGVTLTFKIPFTYSMADNL